MITVNINNQPHSVKEHSSINQLVKQLEISTQGVAIAVNNQVISRATWDTFQISEGDNLLIIQATQGG
ncbi:sulfur carrier protein ThiS [Mesonia phycicola]|uniref:Sulfur carrier protein ThiS n=1 Tax=Mesonia phycicola TaxID=579105 RepID=A0A1M6EBI8_9FLAO|nr:sulfur carrier protein ThiS [Mesonia phycicola]SHI82844.1 sulfur carrier protein ThiS [Mesonia phycicola]